MASTPKGRVLIIAGSDSGGGAGIQADIKTVTMLGGYAATAITALTAQNTLGVHAIHPVPSKFIEQQIRVVLDDIGADAIKIGMLHNAQVIQTVATTLKNDDIPIILDPVMVAKGGASLLEQQAITMLKETLIPMATLITPNIPEAEALTNISIQTKQQMKTAANRLREMNKNAVLIKGGHGTSPTISDLLITKNDAIWLESERIDTPHTHGTGCTLASAIATGIALGIDIKQSVKDGHVYVHAAITHAPGFGKGHGPLGHNVLLKKS